MEKTILSKVQPSVADAREPIQIACNPHLYSVQCKYFGATATRDATAIFVLARLCESEMIFRRRTSVSTCPRCLHCGTRD
jgi:hypothetical protein